MGVIATDKRQITLYYHSETSIGKQTYAYVKSSEKEILAIDIAKTNVTGTQWVEMAKGLNLYVSDLIDTSHPDFVNTFSKQTPKMLQHDWLKILENEPQLLKYPIVINGEKFIQITTSAQFKEYIEPDSADVNREHGSGNISEYDSK